MPTEITVPRQGWSMEEAIFSAWLKDDGELVRAGDALFAIESDKATQEIESFDAGLLHLLPNGPKQGEKVIVGQLIGYLLAAGESAPVVEVTPAKQPSHIPAPPAAEMPVVHARAETPVSTPRARRVARELGVDWTRLSRACASAS